MVKLVEPYKYTENSERETSPSFTTCNSIVSVNPSITVPKSILVDSKTIFGDGTYPRPIRRIYT